MTCNEVVGIGFTPPPPSPANIYRAKPLPATQIAESLRARDQGGSNYRCIANGVEGANLMDRKEQGILLFLLHDVLPDKKT